MLGEIRKVLVVIKKGNKQAQKLSVSIERWLNKRDIEVDLIDTFNIKHTPISSTHMIVVLGGDGTLLYVAREFLTKDIPFLGINFGKVGFLAEILPEEWERTFFDIFLHKDYIVSKRIALKYQVKRDLKPIYSGCAINDIVISRDGLARLLDIFIAIYGEKDPFSFRADGVIVSTPNGSTGYCAAAGGSLIFPELRVLEICPICPFLSRLRPIIIPDNNTVSVKINGTDQDVSLTIDGQAGYSLSTGDIVEISKHEHEIKFIVPKKSSYLQKLKNKGYI